MTVDKPHRISLMHPRLWKLGDADKNETQVAPEECAIEFSRSFNASEGLMEARSVKLVIHSGSPINLLSLNSNTLLNVSCPTRLSQEVDQHECSKAKSEIAYEISPFLLRRNVIEIAWALASPDVKVGEGCISRPRNSPEQVNALPEVPFQDFAVQDCSVTNQLIDIYLEVTS